MGESIDLGLVLTILAALFALAPKLASPEQIVVASLSTTFIVGAFWKISHYLSTKLSTAKKFCAQLSSIVNFGMFAFEE